MARICNHITGNWGIRTNNPIYIVSSAPPLFLLQWLWFFWHSISHRKPKKWSVFPLILLHQKIVLYFLCSSQCNYVQNYIVSTCIHMYPLQPYLLVQLVCPGPRKAGGHGKLLEQLPSLAEEGNRLDTVAGTCAGFLWHSRCTFIYIFFTSIRIHFRGPYIWL